MSIVRANVAFEHGGQQVSIGTPIDSTHYLYTMFPARFTSSSLATVPGSPVTFTQTYSTTGATVSTATAAAINVGALTLLSDAITAIGTIQTALNAAIADALELRKLVNSLIDGQQAAGIAL